MDKTTTCCTEETKTFFKTFIQNPPPVFLCKFSMIKRSFDAELGWIREFAMHYKRWQKRCAFVIEPISCRKTRLASALNGKKPHFRLLYVVKNRLGLNSLLAFSALPTVYFCFVQLVLFFFLTFRIVNELALWLLGSRAYCLRVLAQNGIVFTPLVPDI